MNEEEKKAIEGLKEIATNTYAEGKARTIDTILNLIAKLQKENEELKETYKSEKKMKNEYVKLYQDLLLREEVIPVQKVKYKISERQFELQQEYKDFEDDAILTVLQELLEGRK